MLKSLEENRNPAPGSIFLKLRKETISEILGPRISLFNLSLQNDIVPTDWKMANVTSIFKRRQKYWVIKRPLV